MKSLRVCLAGVLLMLGCQAQALGARPALLEFREALPGLYDFLWKKPLDGEAELDIAPLMPVECRLNSGGEPQRTPDLLIMRGRLQCSDGLAGKSLEIRGLAATRTEVLVRIRYRDGYRESHLVRPVNPRLTFGEMPSTARRLLNYAGLGIERLLLGLDHLLVVLGLLLVADGRRARSGAMVAFVIGHSLALAVALLGHVSLAPLPLNAAIALSVLFLGPEMVRRWRGDSSFTLRHTWVVAFIFGLLHGFGLAGGLGAGSLPPDARPLALAAFNIGIELGLLSLLLLIWLLRRVLRVLQFPPWSIALLPAYLVGSAGAYWTLQRTLLLLGALK